MPLSSPGLRRAAEAAARGVRSVAAAAAGRLRAAWSHRAVRIACPIVATLMLLPPAALVQHVYFDRSDLPELAPFILFQPPTTGEVTDARGEVVIQLAREYRRVVTYDEVPLVMRQAILAAEDKNFHSHSGVDYGALPRVIQKTAGALSRGVDERLRTSAEAGPRRVDDHAAARARLLPGVPDRPPERRCGVRARPDAAAGHVGGPGRPRHQQAASEAGRSAPGALARGSDAQAVWNAGAGEARDLRSLCELHLHGQRPLWLRRGLRVLLRQAAGRLHERGRRAGGVCLRGSASRPATMRPWRAARDRCSAATRSWP